MLTMKDALAPRQLDCFKAIERHYAEHGHSPSMAQIASAMGVTTTAARAHVDALVRKGHARRLYGQPRTISLVGEPRRGDG